VPEQKPRRDGAEEREEIRVYLSQQPAERAVEFDERLGRVPNGPAPGWRRRQRRQATCERCEGDLWIECADGAIEPCQCRTKRFQVRAQRRLRAEGWWRGSSLSWAAPPLAQLGGDEACRLLQGLIEKRSRRSLWIIGPPGSGKSAICAYVAQRLYPSEGAIAARLGDLAAQLRRIGAREGEAAVSSRLAELASTPLLVIDDLDRPSRSPGSGQALGFRESCMAQDIVRVARLLRERRDAQLPTLLTSRALPRDCAERCLAVRRGDLVRGLLKIAAGDGEPLEDFPLYTEALLAGPLLALAGESEQLWLGAESSRQAA
jgi:hypothetical protein